MRVVDHEINAAKVVGRLNDVVDVHDPIGKTDGICLEDVSRFVVCQAGALYMIGVIGKVNLHAVVDTAR